MNRQRLYTVRPHCLGQCCGSGMFIPDPGSDFYPSGSRIRTVSIPDPGSSSKNLSILTPPKKQKKWFLSSKNYDPGCSSRIPDPDADSLPSRIPGSKRYQIPDPDPQHWLGQHPNLKFGNFLVHGHDYFSHLSHPKRKLPSYSITSSIPLILKSNKDLRFKFLKYLIILSSFLKKITSEKKYKQFFSIFWHAI